MTTPAQSQGTGAALQRAEESERELDAEFREANKVLKEYRSRPGEIDPGILAALEKSADLAFKRWNAAAANLLRYDTKVDPSKRLTGTMVPQEEVKDTLKMFMRYWKIGNENAILSCAQSILKLPSSVDVCEAIQDIFRSTVTQSVEQGIEQKRLPAFMIEVLREEL